MPAPRHPKLALLATPKQLVALNAEGCLTLTPFASTPIDKQEAWSVVAEIMERKASGGGETLESN